MHRIRSYCGVALAEGTAMKLAQVGLIVGIFAGLFAIIGGIYKFRIWLAVQIKKVRDMWRDHRRMKADIKDLQEQLAALTQRENETEYTAVTELAGMNLAIDALEKAVARLQADLNERKEVSEEQAKVNSYLR